LGLFKPGRTEPKSRRQLVKEFIKYAAMNMHKEAIARSVASANAGEMRFLGEIANAAQATEKLVKQLRRDARI
jgi:transposase